jgi:DMSO/TMAO reductase YedYZ molybdopterin-dependent catalytic subunit
MSRMIWTRRQMLVRGSAAFGGLLLGGCDRLSQSPSFLRVLSSAEQVTYLAQRLLVGQSLAREFTESDLSPVFRSNGTSNPNNEIYNGLRANDFRDWRLSVEGLVARPLQRSLAALRDMAARTQITRHDCVEGWSAIGQWTGVPLSAVLNRAVPQAAAHYVVFHCADPMDARGTKYYESVDFEDAYHPQTILAYELNGAVLPVANGAPLRVRIERQLGYKMAKYIMRIELVASFVNIGAGNGGYWEDQGYEWYAGI